MTYSERVVRVATGKQLVVQVLLSRGNNDIELVAIKPQTATYISCEEFTARQLRSVGIVGLTGTNAECAWKEPLDGELVDRIAAAFAAYVSVLLQPETESAFCMEPAYDWCAKKYKLVPRN